MKAQGLQAALSSFQTIAVFITTRNMLSEVQALAAKLQKRDQDIIEAYSMVGDVIDNLKAIRGAMDSSFSLWYRDILDLAGKVGVERLAFKGIGAMCLVKLLKSTTKELSRYLWSTHLLPRCFKDLEMLVHRSVL